MCALVKKKAMYKYIYLTVEAYEEYFETSFFGCGSPSLNIHCNTVERGAD